MTTSIRTVALGVVLAIGVAMPVAARDLSVGYVFQRSPLCGGCESVNVPKGFNIDASAPIGQGSLSIVGQFDWSRKSESSSLFDATFDRTFTFTGLGGGVRWSNVVNPRVTRFVQGLVGAVRSAFSGSCEVDGMDFCASHDSSTDMAIQFGGGVAMPINGRTSVVGQVDYRRIFTEGEGTNVIRFVGGVRVKL